MNLEVVLLNDNGVIVAEGICCNTHAQDCIDKDPFGTKYVGVVILESLIHPEVDLVHRFLLCRWLLRNVMIDRISLREHDQ